MLATTILDLWKSLPIESVNPTIENLTFEFPKNTNITKGMFPSRFEPSTLLEFMSFSVTISNNIVGEPTEPLKAVVTFFKTLVGQWMFTISDDDTKAIFYSEMPVYDEMLPVIQKLSNKEAAEVKVRNGDGDQMTMRIRLAEVSVN